MNGKRDEAAPKGTRQIRLETQLRENLKKRKEQARARRRQDGDADGDLAVAADGASRRKTPAGDASK